MTDEQAKIIINLLIELQWQIMLVILNIVIWGLTILIAIKRNK